jgi:cardiolipin synthase
MNLPNLLTLTRVLLIPVFVIFILDHSYLYALITFAIAGITDGVDGLLARLTRQKTELGAYLDPIADKLLIVSAYITLAIIEIIPSWLAVIVITRDVIIMLGILVMLLTSYHPSIRPSFISKITTTFQIMTVLVTLMVGYYSFLSPLIPFAIYGTTLLTILSGAHYIFVGTRILNQKKSTRIS